MRSCSCRKSCLVRVEEVESTSNVAQDATALIGPEQLAIAIGTDGILQVASYSILQSDGVWGSGVCLLPVRPGVR